MDFVPNHKRGSSISAAPDGSPFIHSPLDLQAHEIRVLRVLPRGLENERDPIHCTLQSIRLPDGSGTDSNTPFKALSYTWGWPRPTQTIFINDAPFVVRENLYDFLAAQARLDEQPLLWIDQICIDQDNGRERNHQVNQMAQIYRAATEVIVWLGNAFAGSDALMHSLESSRPQRIYHEYSAIDIPTSRRRPPRLPRETPLIHVWWALASLPYWTRLWVRQEIMLAREIMLVLGTKRLKWNVFSACWGSVRPIVEVNEPSRLGWEHVQLLIETRESMFDTPVITSGLGWKAAIKLARGANCQIPIDRIYGLNGLVGSESAIDVDYTRSSRDVFYLVAEAGCRELKTKKSTPKGHTSQLAFLRILRSQMRLDGQIKDKELSEIIDQEHELLAVEVERGERQVPVSKLKDS